METGEISTQYDLNGSKLFQKRARVALPILVRQAQVSRPIFYSDLTTEIGMPNVRNLNFVLGLIGASIQALSEKFGEEIPLINCLVVNKKDCLPGEGIGWFIDKNRFRELPKSKKTSDC